MGAHHHNVQSSIGSSSESLILTRGRSSNAAPFGALSQDKLGMVADKTIFKATTRKDSSSLSTQFTKLSMADRAQREHAAAKLISSVSSGSLSPLGQGCSSSVSAPAEPIGSKFLSNLLEEQKKCRPLPDYLRRVQKDVIQESMRGDIVNWLLEVCAWCARACVCVYALSLIHI